MKDDDQFGPMAMTFTPENISRVEPLIKMNLK